MDKTSADTENTMAMSGQLFNLIAPFYGLFYNFQKKNYTNSMAKLEHHLDLSQFKNILDIGCGTGALCNVLNQKGLSVIGIDPAQKMLNIAREKNQGNNIEFIQANVTKGLPFKDKFFDLSITSYVAHGLEEDVRKILYKEMLRVTKNAVIIYDFSEKRSLIIDIIEKLEGGDYFNFIKNIKRELTDTFGRVEIIKINERAALYICSLVERKNAESRQT